VNPRQLWVRIQRWYAGHTTRDRRILAGVAGAVVVSLLYVGVAEPIVHYRRRVADEIGEGQEQLERSARFLAAGDGLRAERDDLKKRLEEAKKRLLPGGSATLGAAALQERANAIAQNQGITVQSTQVMKEEPADPFRKVSIRLTLSGELKPFSELLSGLEYGPQQLTVPFLEVTRRGAVAGQKGPRTLSATVELSGYLLGEQAPKSGESEGAEGEAEAAVPPVEGEATGENPPGKAPVEGQPGAPAAEPKAAAEPPNPPSAEGPPPVAPAGPSEAAVPPPGPPAAASPTPPAAQTPPPVAANPPPPAPATPPPPAASPPPEPPAAPAAPPAAAEKPTPPDAPTPAAPTAANPPPPAPATPPPPAPAPAPAAPTPKPVEPGAP